MEQSNRTMRMYQSLVEIAEQALLNMETQQSAPASTTAELDPSILKAFAKRLVKVLDEIAAGGVLVVVYWRVAHGLQRALVNDIQRDLMTTGALRHRFVMNCCKAFYM